VVFDGFFFGVFDRGGAQTPQKTPIKNLPAE
jgi:hypothetical protein